MQSRRYAYTVCFLYLLSTDWSILMLLADGFRPSSKSSASIYAVCIAPIYTNWFCIYVLNISILYKHTTLLSCYSSFDIIDKTIWVVVVIW